MNMKKNGSAQLNEPAERVPTVGTDALRKNSKTVLQPDAPPLAIEQYRRLAAVLHRAQQQNGTRILMVASAVPGEGKTLTACNLALTLSQSYRRRVMLIDADLRRPTTHLVLQLPNVSGLNEALKAHGSWKPPVYEISSHLSVLTAGKPNPDPMSGITSDAMRRLLQWSAESSDWVVVDTPPVGLLPDAHLLGPMVDAVVMVIAAGHAPYRLVQRAVETIGRERIIGVVLNRIEAAAIGQTYGYHAYGYYGTPRS